MNLPDNINFFFKILNLKIESDNWSVYCIPGFSITSFYNGESIQKTEKQEFTFRVKTQDIIDNEIQSGDIFFYSTDCYQYNFQIPADYKPIEDINIGLSKIVANFLSREVL